MTGAGGGSANFVYSYGVDGALLMTNGIEEDSNYNAHFAARQAWREHLAGRVRVRHFQRRSSRATRGAWRQGAEKTGVEGVAKADHI